MAVQPVSAVMSAATRDILSGRSTMPCCRTLTTIDSCLVSQNCIKHKAMCSYSHSPSRGELPISKARLWSAEAKTVVRQWREARSMPISDDRIGATLDPYVFSTDDLHFVYQVVKNQHRLENMGVSKLTVASSYLPTFFPIIPMSRLAMNGVLALSAYQVASVTHSGYACHKEYQYQELAFQELRKCLDNLEPEHVDGALVASLALLWLCEDMSVHHVSLGIQDADTIRSSRGKIAAGISAVSTNLQDSEQSNSLECQILQTFERSVHQSEFCHMIAHAWGQTVNMPTTPDPGCRNTSGLQKIIDEMWKFAKVLGDHKPDDDTRRQLSLLIALAEDMVKVGPIASTDKHSEWFRLLRYYKLSLPFKDLLTDKDLSNILMVNAYLHTVALYSPPQLTQPYSIDLRVDLPSLLDETLLHLGSSGAYVRLLRELKAIVLLR
ncbi:unnamed protein product [Fusarium fujikuroi]|nr:unnamed protein product [Fusarium fujikuroi]